MCSRNNNNNNNISYINTNQLHEDLRSTVYEGESNENIKYFLSRNLLKAKGKQ